MIPLVDKLMKDRAYESGNRLLWQSSNLETKGLFGRWSDRSTLKKGTIKMNKRTKELVFTTRRPVDARGEILCGLRWGWWWWSWISMGGNWEWLWEGRRRGWRGRRGWWMMDDGWWMMIVAWKRERDEIIFIEILYKPILRNRPSDVYFPLSAGKEGT